MGFHNITLMMKRKDMKDERPFLLLILVLKVVVVVHIYISFFGFVLKCCNEDAIMYVVCILYNRIIRIFYYVILGFFAIIYIYLCMYVFM